MYAQAIGTFEICDARFALPRRDRIGVYPRRDTRAQSRVFEILRATRAIVITFIILFVLFYYIVFKAICLYRVGCNKEYLHFTLIHSSL